ncbi:MAG: hypothetical protein DRP12_02555 [Candidatus Aenigmatarchaeota archaeon]|nr:MAG: hypothetical protein DRP12_02555 [Candidatus Aenigmarchaeota archaeon]
MRWAFLLIILLVCGCVQTGKVIEKTVIQERIICGNISRICPSGEIVSCQPELQNGSCQPCTPECPPCPACGPCEIQVNCSCMKIRPCCGDGYCDDGEICPEDCGEKVKEFEKEEPEKEVSPEKPQSHLLITEIMYNPVQPDRYNEWIEIYNPGPDDLDLTGWTLCGKELEPGWIRHSDGESFPGNPVLKAGSYAIITDGGTGTDAYENWQFTCQAYHPKASSLCGGLKNSNHTVWIADENGRIVVNVSYSSANGANGNGKSLSWNSGWVETNSNPCS